MNKNKVIKSRRPSKPKKLSPIKKDNKKSVICKEKLTDVQSPIVDVEPVVSEDMSQIKKKRKKRGEGTVALSKFYFTQDTENAITQYNKETDMDKRNEIYNTSIKYPFEKLVENIFNTFKFTYFDVSPIEIQRETVTHLVSIIHRYESEKGKAYSYFSIIAKHYLILLNNGNYKKFNQQVDISEEREENTVQLQCEDTHHKDVENNEFMGMVIRFWENSVSKIFNKQKDLNIANAIIELFRNSDRIDTYNKKSLYLYIREISACKTQQITRVINKMKQYQADNKKLYIKNGVFSTTHFAT